MYDFVDVNEVSKGSALPSEALKINGAFIENQITGYRTLTVSGREALSPEVDTFSVGERNGSTLNYKRYPERIITVQYQLICKDNAAFRAAYNKLASILNVENAELIFNDELDKFFIGTPSSIGEVEPGSNSVTGEFEILCTDPFKYSITEYEVSPTLDDGKTFIVDYKGTHEAFPTFEVDFYEENETDGDTSSALTGNGDCGFVAFFNEDEKIIQVGDPDETEGESYAKSQTLVNQSFRKSNSWGSAAKAIFTVNNGTVSSSALVQTGNVGAKQAYANAPEGEYYLSPTSYGSGEKWHGPSVTRIIPADGAGEVGAVNFSLQYVQKLSIGTDKNAVNELGAFQILLVNRNGNSKKVVAGVNVFKGSSGKNATLRIYVNGKYYDETIDLSLNNKYFGNNTSTIKTVKTTTISKSGGTLEFNVGGIKKTYRDSALSDVAVHELTFTMSQFGSKPALSFNGVYSVKFTKHNCDTWRNIPNKFGSNDVVLIDCSKGEIYMNDALTPALGALGNDWENFTLKKGVNQIGVTYSDWLPDAYAPTFKMRYREVFL